MSTRAALPLSLAALVLALSAAPVRAQGAPLPPPAAPINGPGQVLSANPFGLVIDLFNSEYEMRGGHGLTFGAGASTRHTTIHEWDATRRVVTDRRERYVNGDLFLRYYPGGRAFEGRSFGVKAGYTHIPTQGSYFGIGFDANQSWMLNEHFFLGTGFGLKRLIGTNEANFDLKYIPTLRMNIGVGF